MLVIYDYNLDAFLPEGEKFIPFAVEHLRKEHSQLVKGFSDTTLQKMVQIGAKRTQKYHLDSAMAKLMFITLMFTQAPNFDEHNDIQTTLEQQNVPALKRMKTINQQTSQETWQEVKQNYDATIWKKVFAR